MLLHRVANGRVGSDVNRVAVPRVDHVPGGQPRPLLLVCCRVRGRRSQMLLGKGGDCSYSGALAVHVRRG